MYIAEENWGDLVRRLADKMLADRQTIAKAAVLRVWADVIVRTPVDTGRARGSWNISLNVTDTSALPDLKGEKSALNTSIPPGAEQMGRARGVMDSFVWGDTIIISNNVPYIVFLENGSSKQAPHGMARLAVRGMMEEIKRGLQ